MQMAALGALAAFCLMLIVFQGLAHTLLAYVSYPVVVTRDYVVRTVNPFVSEWVGNRAVRDENARLRAEYADLASSTEVFRLTMQEQIRGLQEPVEPQFTASTTLFDAPPVIATTSTSTYEAPAFEISKKQYIPVRKIGRVLSKPPFSPFDTIVALLENGGEDLVQGKEIFIISPSGAPVPIGTVTSVSGKTVIVDLFSKPKSTFPVMFGTSTVSHVAFGKGGGMFQTEIPKGLFVAEGLEVYSVTRPNEVFSYINHVDGTEVDPLVTVTFMLPISLFELKDIYVAE
jgi:hypothetical protein